MTPAKHLEGEHEIITLMLKILEKVCAKMETKETVALAHLEGVVDFFRTFIDQCHHGKEEELLFPAILPMERKLINVLLGEHSQGRSHVRAMGQALAQRKKHEERALAEYAAPAQKYIALMTQHIRKENTLLFPMLDQILAKKGQIKLVEGFEDWEEKEIGKGIHERFQQFLQDLAEVYK